MKRGIEHLILLNERMLKESTIGKPLNIPLVAELQATVAALRKQRADDLAQSKATVIKANRNSSVFLDPKPDSYQPIEIYIGTKKIRICDHRTGDELADRLAASWNFCFGLPMDQLIAGGPK